jgi:hypothetical protein
VGRGDAFQFRKRFPHRSAYRRRLLPFAASHRRLELVKLMLSDIVQPFSIQLYRYNQEGFGIQRLTILTCDQCRNDGIETMKSFVAMLSSCLGCIVSAELTDEVWKSSSELGGVTLAEADVLFLNLLCKMLTS